MESGKQERQSPGKKRFLFNVDIMVEGYNNGIALETILNILNQDGRIKDYKINQGIELGKLIDSALQEQKKATEKPAPAVPAVKAETAKAEAAKNDNQDIYNLIDFFKNNNTLVRLSVIKAKGVKLSIPCRILNFDPSTCNLTVYHVDEKKVYQFNVNEIDDFKVN